jgi:hypothetical protein
MRPSKTEMMNDESFIIHHFFLVEWVMKLPLCTALLLPLLLAVAAAARGADDKAPETPYFPLKIGESWNYKMGDSKFTLKVAKFEDVDKQQCARVEMSAGAKVVSFDHVAIKADGVYRYTTEGNKAEPPLCFLKLPVKKGEEWKVASAVGALGKVSGTFKSGEAAEDVKVPAGTYKKEDVVTVTCDDLDAAGMKAKVTYYFAKGVGMVKQTIAVGGQEVVIELEKPDAAK